MYQFTATSIASPTYNLRNQITSEHASLVLSMTPSNEFEATKEFYKLLSSVYTGEVVELMSPNSGSTIWNGHLNSIYRVKLNVVSRAYDFTQREGWFNIQNWLSDRFRELYPTQHKAFSDFFDSPWAFAGNWICNCVNGHVVSISNYMPRAVSDQKSIDAVVGDSMYYFGIPDYNPGGVIPRQFLASGKHIDALYKSEDCQSPSSSLRITIGPGYLRIGSFEFKDNDFSYMISSSLIHDADPKMCLDNKVYYNAIAKNKFTTTLDKLIRGTLNSTYAMDYNSRTCWHNPIGYVQADDPCGLALKHSNIPKEVLDNQFSFWRFKLSNEDIEAIRNRDMDHPYGSLDLLLDPVKDIDEHKTRKSRVSWKSLDSQGIFLSITKSSSKTDSERKAYVTRVGNTIQQYLLSAAYSIILHRDLRTPRLSGELDDVFKVDTFKFGLRAIKYGSNVNTYDSPACYYAPYEIIIGGEITTNNYERHIQMSDQIKGWIRESTTTFAAKYSTKQIKSSLSGTSSCISTYYILPHLADRSITHTTEFSAGMSWIFLLDSQCGNNNYNRFSEGGFPRRRTNGIDLATKSISLSYLLGLLAFSDSSRQYRDNPLYSNQYFYDPTAKLAADAELANFVGILREFYSDNCIPLSEIEEAFDSGTLIHSNRFNCNSRINYQEIYSLSTESLGILDSGHKCSSLEESMDWWAKSSPLLREMASNDPNLISHKTRIGQVLFMLDYIDAVVEDITINIDKFVVGV